MIFIFIWIFRL